MAQRRGAIASRSWAQNSLMENCAKRMEVMTRLASGLLSCEPFSSIGVLSEEWVSTAALPDSTRIRCPSASGTHDTHVMGGPEGVDRQAHTSCDFAHGGVGDSAIEIRLYDSCGSKCIWRISGLDDSNKRRRASCPEQDPLIRKRTFVSVKQNVRRWGPESTGLGQGNWAPAHDALGGATCGSGGRVVVGFYCRQCGRRIVSLV